MTKIQRDLIGHILCFLSCCLFGGVGLAFWMLREVWQAHKGDFPIEMDDIGIRSVLGGLGSVINAWFIVELTLKILSK